MRVLEPLAIWLYEGLREAFNGHEDGVEKGLRLGFAQDAYRPHRLVPCALPKDLRLQHCHLMGASGSGKTTLMESMIKQDILAGRGLAHLDAHGDSSERLLHFLASQPERIQRRVILVDPSDPDWAVGINPLAVPEGATSFNHALELVAAFRKAWEQSWGPRLEEMLRSLLVSLSEAGLTLLEAVPFLTIPHFRRAVSACGRNPEVRAYWSDRYDRLSEAAQASYREALLNKLTAFTSDPLIRTIVGQAKPTLSLRRAMDRGRVILVNLSPGRLRGNAELLGGLLLGSLVSAAYSRADLPESRRRSFFLYADELQRLASEEFPAVVSELRKYGVGLVVANQHLVQLSSEVRAALLANVATKVLFRLGVQDAAALRGHLTYEERERWGERLPQLPVGQALLLQPNRPARLLHALAPERDACAAEEFRDFRAELLRRSARPRREVEREIAGRRERFLADGHGNGQETHDPAFAGRASDEGQSDW